jgi:hypothetical protein
MYMYIISIAARLQSLLNQVVHICIYPSDMLIEVSVLEDEK